MTWIDSSKQTECICSVARIDSVCASMRKVEVEYICEKVSEDMGGAIVTTILFELKASLHVV